MNNEMETHAATLDELEALDMDMFSAEEPTTDSLGWRIADDEAADWAVAKIAEERAELTRIKALADEKINRIMETAPPTSRQSSRNTSAPCPTKRQRRPRATGFCPALSK